MLNKVCGTVGNLTQLARRAPHGGGARVLAESSHNLLTVWWHASTADAHAGGFKLLWTAFRDADEGATHNAQSPAAID